MGVSLLPEELLASLPQGAVVVEIGVGGRWDHLETLSRERPDLRLTATDVHDAALEDPPQGVRTAIDDVTDPRLALHRRATLIYAVRCPEELQIPLARLARTIGATLAIRALKDEWADLSHLLGGPRLMRSPDGRTWRVWRP